MTLILFFIGALPNIGADIGAFLLALLIETKTKYWFPKSWQRVSFGMMSFLIIQIILFILLGILIKIIIGVVAYDSLISSTSKYTSILYPIVAISLIIVLIKRQRRRFSSQTEVQKMSLKSGILFASVTILLIGMIVPIVPALYSSYKFNKIFVQIDNQEIVTLENEGSLISCPQEILTEDLKLSTLSPDLYINEKYNYSIRFPLGWILEANRYHDGKGGYRPIATPPKAVNTININNRMMVSNYKLTGSSLDGCNSLKSCTAEAFQFNDDQEKSCASLKVGDNDARILEYSVNGYPEPGHIIVFITVKENTLYRVSADFDSSDIWQRYRKVVLNSLHSFSFTD